MIHLYETTRDVAGMKTGTRFRAAPEELKEAGITPSDVSTLGSCVNGETSTLAATIAEATSTPPATPTAGTK